VVHSPPPAVRPGALPPEYLSFTLRHDLVAL